MPIETLSVSGYEKVIKTQLDGGLTSIIAIHNTKRGPALGGIRFYPYASEKEALTDVLHLAEAMTYKAALAGLSLGGGKSVIIGDPQKHKTPELLKSFGKFVDSLEGTYITAKDVGVKLADIDTIATVTRNVAGTTLGGSGDPSFMTAYGVYQGLQAGLHDIYGDSSLKNKKMIIQGLGGVGWHLAKILVEKSAVVSATDIDEKVLGLAVNELGITSFSPEELSQIKGDVFAPCAMGGVITARMIPQLRHSGIKLVAGSANNQLSQEQADGWRLHRERILYAPDYVINSGGLINVACELTGYQEAKAKKMTEQIKPTLEEIFNRAKKEDRPTCLIAREMAMERIAAGS